MQYRSSIALIVVACLASGTATDGAAQTGPLGQVLNAPSALNELRSEQSALFERLLQEPDNLDLMFEYALLSIRLEDYEAAISTLERMLIYRQDLSRVRLELGVAYFSLGSYQAAQVYFDQVLADPSTPDNVRARVNQFKSAIAERTQRNAFSVLATAGLTYATNATLGPGDEVIGNIFGNPTLLQIIDGGEESDVGFRGVLAVTHAFDLQRPNNDIWRTDFSAFTLRYFDTTSGDVDFLRLRTGPRLSLDEQQFGPKIRPYVEGSYLRSAGEGLFTGFGGGFELSDTLSPVVSVFSDAGLFYREYVDDFDDEDALTAAVAAGVAYIPFRDLVLRSTALLERDAAAVPENSNYEIGLRLSAEYQYDSGISWIDRKWSASAFTEVRGRFFDADDPVVGLDQVRKDVDLRAGLSHVFTLREGFGIQFDVDALRRDSNIVNFDLDNISLNLSAQYRL